MERFFIPEVYGKILDMLPFQDLGKVMLISKSDRNHAEKIKERYRASVSKISRFVNSRKVFRFEVLTKNSFIRLILRTYEDPWIENYIFYSKRKIGFMLSDDQLEKINEIEKKYPGDLTRRELRDYLRILTLDQIEYMGY